MWYDGFPSYRLSDQPDKHLGCNWALSRKGPRIDCAGELFFPLSSAWRDPPEGVRSIFPEWDTRCGRKDSTEAPLRNLASKEPLHPPTGNFPSGTHWVDTFSLQNKSSIHPSPVGDPRLICSYYQVPLCDRATRLAPFEHKLSPPLSKPNLGWRIGPAILFFHVPSSLAPDISGDRTVTSVHFTWHCSVRVSVSGDLAKAKHAL